MASQQGRANQHEPACFGLYPLLLPVTFGHTTPALVFSEAIHFAVKYSAPCSAVLRHSPSSWAAVVHWSALMPKALRSSRKHPIHSLLAPHTARALHHFSEHHALRQSLVSSMRATNPANKIYGVGITDRAKGSLLINLRTLDWVETHKTSTPPKDLYFLDWVRTRQTLTQMGTRNQRVGITDRAKESLVPNLLTTTQSGVSKFGTNDSFARSVIPTLWFCVPIWVSVWRVRTQSKK